MTHGFQIEFLAHSKDEQVACRVTRRKANVELYDAAFYEKNVKSRQTYASLAKYDPRDYWA